MIAGAITAIFRRPIRRPSRNGARPNGAERAGAKGTGEDSRVHFQHGMLAADPNGSMEDGVASKARRRDVRKEP